VGAAGAAQQGDDDKGKMTMAMRQVFLDTETTGLSPESGDRVIEIGCVEMVNRRLTGRTLHHYLNPERPNSEDAVRIHGLTDEFLADKPLFASIADELIAFCAGAEIVIHNAGFDVGFLDEELRRIDGPKFTAVSGAVTDTLLMAREMFPGKSNSLDALCKRLEVDNASRTLHGALLDAGLLAEVYIRMTRGQNALVIDETHAGAGDGLLEAVDFGALTLVVVEADEEEAAAHEAVLAQLDKASGGRTLWRLAPGLAAGRQA
jgi:DNA polymerase-3 subunit epsilon